MVRKDVQRRGTVEGREVTLPGRLRLLRGSRTRLGSGGATLRSFIKRTSPRLRIGVRSTP